MKFVVYSVKKEMYLATTPTTTWVEEIGFAAQFNSEKNANNVIISTYKNFVKDAECEVRVFTPQTEGEKIQFDCESAGDAYNQLQLAAREFSQSMIKLTALIDFYGKELSKCDLMQEDVLHKIEFDSVMGVQGVRLVKQLKEIRIKRREVKDKLSFLTMLKTKGMTGAASIWDWEKAIEDRKYTPRVLDELFK